VQIAPVNSELSADQLTKPSGDERNVFQMLPQRRDLDGIDIEAVEEVSVPAVMGTVVFVLNAVLLLRLPVHARVRTLNRHKALKFGSLVHLLWFGITGIGSTDVEGVMVIFSFAFKVTNAYYAGESGAVIYNHIAGQRVASKDPNLRGL
jgi:hypothetical protein